MWTHLLWSPACSKVALENGIFVSGFREAEGHLRATASVVGSCRERFSAIAACASFWRFAFVSKGAKPNLDW